MADQFDLVIVGGGIAGAALACGIASSGLGVLVLERQDTYRDRVRGEAMMAWGVLEARRLGIEQLLLDAGGGYATTVIAYEDWTTPAEAEAGAAHLGALIPEVGGLLNVGHPQASEALARGAANCGATVVRGVESVDVTLGASPSVQYAVNGNSHDVACRLVVGADGRRSAVRAALGAHLHGTDPRTMLAGLLVAGLDAWPSDHVAIGTYGDVHYLVFPRPGGIARLYLSYDIAAKDRFTGENRAHDFLDSFRVPPLPIGELIASATPAGPCAGYPGVDSWTEQPYGPGAVLIGDAAGWSDPLIGQGLSVALRDARTVTDALLAQSMWRPEIVRRLPG